MNMKGITIEIMQHYLRLKKHAVQALIAEM